MEGRWTIHMRGWGHLVSSADPKDVAAGSWPVVPCDDAAIRQVAAALKTIPLMDVAEEPYATAERLLRAAGETP